MKKVKVITKNAELEEFLARTDIEIINVDIMSCEQSWFAQEYFTATVYYDDEPKSDYTPDYWTRLEHQATISIYCAHIGKHLWTRSYKSIISEAHDLVEKMKEKV